MKMSHLANFLMIIMGGAFQEMRLAFSRSRRSRNDRIV
jgi:hypothetical protein